MSDNKVFNWRRNITRLIITLVLMIYTVITLFPMLWSIYSSLKSSNEILASPWGLPSKLNFQNYINAFTKANMGDYFLNSIFITILSLVLLLVLAIPTSYVLARFKFMFSKTLKNIFVAGLFIQVMIYLVPLFLLVNKVHLLNNRLVLCVIYAVTSLPFTIFLLISFMKSIPKDYEDAAMIDGCNYFGILVKIIVPMVKPAVVTVSIFSALGFWNEFPLAFTFISSSSKKTLSVGLANLMEIQRYATDWGALFAGLAIVMIPTLLFYVFTQKKLTEGVSIGGLKG